MDKGIHTAREGHATRDTAEYHAKHRAFIETERTVGGRDVEIHESGRLVAYVSHGRWVVMCECGAGNDVDVGARLALCFACGAVHDVVLPRHRDRIEAELLRRPKTKTRNWEHGETVADLRAENRDNGIE